MNPEDRSPGVEERDACRDAFLRIEEDILLLVKLAPDIDFGRRDFIRSDLVRAARNLHMASDYCGMEGMFEFEDDGEVLP